VAGTGAERVLSGDLAQVDFYIEDRVTRPTGSAAIDRLTSSQKGAGANPDPASDGSGCRWALTGRPEARGLVTRWMGLSWAPPWKNNITQQEDTQVARR
jgi:hypothetical protein